MSLNGIERTEGKLTSKAAVGHSRVETTQDHYLTIDDMLARTVAQNVG